MHLYITNLSLNVDEDDLTDIFSEYGTVNDVVVLKDPVTSNPIGNAVVTMPRKSQAGKAMANLNLTKIKDRRVLIGVSASTGNRRARSRKD